MSDISTDEVVNKILLVSVLLLPGKLTLFKCSPIRTTKITLKITRTTVVKISFLVFKI